jgi:hypothetical protein
MEGKHNANPRSKTVHLCIHDETTHEADRSAHRIDGVRRLRFEAPREYSTNVGSTLLPWHLAVLIGSLSYNATVSSR